MLNIDLKYLDSNLDPGWDNCRIDYDLDLFPWPTIFQSVIQEQYPQVTDLTRLHEALSTSELIEFRKFLERFTRSHTFQQEVDRFVAHVLEKNQYPHPEYMIQLTPGLRIVVPDQLKKNRLLNFHTGYWTGYDNGTCTIWTPITPAYDTNTMWVTDWSTSRDLMHRIHSERWPMSRIQTECESVSRPVECSVGQSWLFAQGHLHGNVNNTTGQSRLSFDVRVAHPGIEFGRRRPGSYYRFPGQSTQIDPARIRRDLNWLAFVSPNDEYINMAPYFMIREFLLQWCRSVDIQPLEWSNEYHECEWMPKFQDFISRQRVGIVLASIYNFSITPAERIELFREAIANQNQLIFVDENIIVDQESDLDQIQELYRFYYKNKTPTDSI
jgi:hypothetical protein